MKLDLLDALLILGFLMMIAGVALVHLPSALAVAGLLIASAAILITGRARHPRERK